MTEKTDILRELGQLSQVLVNIGNRNVYTVPQAYFDTLDVQPFAHIRLLALKNSPAPFDVPEGYFTSLAGNVIAKINEQNRGETVEIDTGLPAASSFTVPAGYFDNLAGNVMAKIKTIQQETGDEQEEELPAFLRGIALPYTVPAGYFDTVAGNVAGKIKNAERYLGNGVFAELEETAPLLNSINKTMPFTVPAGYFEGFAVSLDAEDKQQPKVIPMPRRSRKTWLMYAAAACFAVLLGIGAYIVIPSPGGTDGPRTDKFNVQKALAAVSIDDISSYLDSEPVTSPEASPVATEEQVPDIQTEINSMSTKDIQQYLKENSDPGENGGKHI